MLADLASRQHGVVTRRQLLAAEISRHTVTRRVASGGLIPVHAGVYVVGHHALAPLAMEAAAILACSPNAVLSHLTAARLWKLPVPDAEAIQVTVVGRSRRSLPGVQVHYLREIAAVDLRRHRGLPLSAPALTLLDLAGISGDAHLPAALNEARVLRLVCDRELRAVLDRHPNRRGAGALRRLLDAERGPMIVRSEAERRCLAIMGAHGITPDATDHPVGPYRLDFWFERERLAVEVDGYRYHATPKRFVDDRRRTAYLAARGIQTFPLTWTDLSHPEGAMARLQATLALRRAA